MAVFRTDPKKVIALAVDLQRPRHRSATGYGDKNPTQYRIKLSDNRWRRVYAICYGNAASVYVNSNGVRLFLDDATEYALQDGNVPINELGL